MKNCVHDQPKISEKCTQLETIRKACRYDKRMFAHILGLPYRTYQDYAYSKRGVPDSVIAKALAAMKREREVMAGIIAEINSEIDRKYPQGIPSEVKG